MTAKTLRDRPVRVSDVDLYLECLPGWADLYVDGTWTLERFEAHADAMRESLFAPLWTDAELRALLVCGICLDDHGNNCCCGEGRFRSRAIRCGK